jgi:hypothetical protein
MNFVSVPNIPDRPVKYAVVDGRISRKCEEKLASLGISSIKTQQHEGVYEAVSFHPDIMLHHLGDGYIVLAPGTGSDIAGELKRLGFTLIMGSTRLLSSYPHDIAYNVARVGNIAFHNLKYTDSVLKSELVKRGVKLVHVNQGYSKCSISVVSSSCIITSDKGIARAAEENSIDVLVLEEDKNILLPGMSNGFIGGCSGLIDRNKWVVTGDFNRLACAKDIQDFLACRGIDIVSLSDEEIFDVGSLLPLVTK